MRKLAARASPRGFTAFDQAPKRVVASATSVPVPVEGWDSATPKAAMSPKRAIRMDNWFPHQSYVEVRKGFMLHCELAAGQNPVETLMPYNGVLGSKLFAAQQDKIFDATTDTPVLELSGLNNARWQHVNFGTTGGQFLYIVNGADDPRHYNGTAWATPVITGISASNAIHINIHKRRIWFVMRDSLNAAYLPVDSIAGAGQLFPLQQLFSLGGSLMAMGTWSLDAGNGPDDYAVFVSSKGQVAVFAGTDPATNFALVGMYSIGEPIGRRCLIEMGADLAVICMDGLIPLSRTMIFERAAQLVSTFTKNIQPDMNLVAQLHRNNFGWQVISYPRGTRAILNIPLDEGDEQIQFVMNTLSGAWCRFTGMNANCWAIFQERLFFGGNEGIVFEADVGGTDFDATLRADMMTAFNYFGTRGRKKTWGMVRSNVTTNGIARPGIAVNVDFEEDAQIFVPSTLTLIGSLWDSAQWDVDLWGAQSRVQNQWQSIKAHDGHCASIRMVVDIVAPGQGLGGFWAQGLWGINSWGGLAGGGEIELQVNGFDVTYQTGDFI